MGRFHHRSHSPMVKRWPVGIGQRCSLLPLLQLAKRQPRSKSAVAFDAQASRGMTFKALQRMRGNRAVELNCWVAFSHSHIFKGTRKMTPSRMAQAARNNALWCDTVCRTHGIPGEFSDALWLNRHPVPRFYSNAVTLADPHAAAAQLAHLRALVASGPPGR